MHCNKVSFQELLDCFDDHLENNNYAEKLQEILNRVMLGIISIITSILVRASPIIIMRSSVKSVFLLA